jgi:tetratricopeptide (TPR) repeat protein
MRIAAFILLCLGSLVIKAQQSTVWLDPDFSFREGLELYDVEKYGAAQNTFRNFIEQRNTPQSEVSKAAQYYAALCAVELFNPDAEFLLTQFVAQHPESPLVKQAWFQLGKFFFRDKKYKKAVEWMQMSDPELLTEEEQAEYHFKLGYAYFKVDNYDRALAELAAVKDQDSEYSTVATYYYGHVQYHQGNFESALEHFLKLSNDETFGRIVPFYISQIYYLQKRYDQVINYAQPVLDTTKSKRGPEIARLIGESYYNTNRYKEAIPYLERFRDEANAIRSREDEYQLGFAYFKVNAHEKAVTAFEKATGSEDALGQNAWYHLGWCQLQLGNKKFARSAWAEAAKLSFDTLLKEQTLFDYAKLAYELGHDPYDEAVRALQDYINAYPQSTRMDEAYTFLANIYMTTRNYRTALMSLDRIKSKNDKLKEAYQRVAFYRGIELLNDRNNPEAIRHFDLSLQFATNKELAGLANYWKAEAQYRSGDYAEAVKGFQQFIYSLNAFNQKTFNRANYNLGYAFFKQRDYTNALTWFRKYTASYASAEQKIAADAFIRSGDCFFMKGDYSGAAESYDKAVTMRIGETDYALYQRGMALAVMGKSEAQIKVHQQLLSDFPQSSFVDDAKWEIARTYENMGRYEEAYSTYNGILINHEASAYVPMAKLQMAGIRYNQNRDQEAKVLFLEVIEQYPGTPQFTDAQIGLKRIYTDEGKVIEYQEFAKEKGLEQLSGASYDSTAWEAAENVYLKDGDCNKAITRFEAYLKNFPTGIFSLKALGMKADCQMKLRQIDSAAVTYQLITQRPRNKYTSEANQMLGIYFRQKEEYTEALRYFKDLENTAENAEQTLTARSNIMRIALRTGNETEAEQYARKLVEADKANEDLRQEARLIIARGHFRRGEEKQAMEEFNRLKKVNSEVGAESRFYIAQIHHNSGDYKKCEKAVFDLVDEMPSYDYWLAKAFILLSENYLKLGNIFQARRTLQSVIDNHEGEELRNLAIQKLAAIDQQEAKPDPIRNTESESIPMGNERDEKLFDTPPSETVPPSANPVEPQN